MILVLVKYVMVLVMVFPTLPAGEDVKNTEENISGGLCWQDEKYEIVEKCHPCNSHELVIHQECKHTGYIEEIKCANSGFAIKRCPRDKHMEMVTFWKFEVGMIFMSIITATAVMFRMRKLDHENQERIQRQISAL
uniref:Protein JTB-like n=1 Tax=Phallusia mammillata TaxID=59560 RepID=A0A6F9DG57_9ASCI|nr:protein JTB-like [Phallusia mammillata]